VGRAVAGTRVAPAYLLIVASSSRVLAGVDPATRQRMVLASSTNLHNLGSGHLEVLLASAAITDRPLGVPGWSVASVALVGAEALWGPGWTTTVFLLGHVGGSLLVAAGLTALQRLGVLPATTTRAADVGISYGLLAVLGAHAADLPPRRPALYAAGGLALLGGVAATSRTFTDAGHLTAFALGLGAGGLRRRRRAPVGQPRT